ncbi:hypothetical protein IB232_04875 [Pseudomonas sp. PDM15]|uniref:hypothetical protein n=1 Tax=Pseudomonas sp. PDM15 TaxID=2769303 RepID=UPI001783E782|nr:hypothetical protein [Pseudomonas sp. PDM15]MBD9424644.1 hypothetical protein [Pseudomonas sp. PDM15]
MGRPELGPSPHRLSAQVGAISAENSGALITLDSQSRVFVLGVVADQLNDANLQFVGV